MVQTDELQPGQMRLLEVDKPIVIPCDTTVRTLVTGADVIHSWTLLGTNLKADGVPGRLNQLALNVPTGLYIGQCSEHCGVGHSFMPIAAEAIPQEHYIEWVYKFLRVGYWMEVFSTEAKDWLSAQSNPDWIKALVQAKLQDWLESSFKARCLHTPFPEHFFSKWAKRELANMDELVHTEGMTWDQVVEGWRKDALATALKDWEAEVPEELLDRAGDCE